MTTEEKREIVRKYCENNTCECCEIFNLCRVLLPTVSPRGDQISPEVIEQLYNEFTGGKAMKPETTENNTITISRSEYDRLRTAEAELETRQRENSNTVTLDRSEYNMLIKVQGLLDLICSTYKNAAADYRLCEFLDIIFKETEDKS